MDPSGAPFSQSPARVRCDWGSAGAEAIAGSPDLTAVVVVDVLSFTTSVSIAADRGIAVLPYRWADDGARAFAIAQDAVLADARSERTVSLSPASLAIATGIERVVLPSPNGSAISSALGDRGYEVIAGSLRNAGAVAAWCSSFLASDPARSVSVVMAGERWAGDRSLRPAAEDLWGAGAILRGLPSDLLSVEAGVALAAFDAVGDLRDALRECASGRELIVAGFDADVILASDLDVSRGVPLLARKAFVLTRPETRVS